MKDYYEPNEIIHWLHDWTNGITEEDYKLL